jgi:hypothetical protein
LAVHSLFVFKLTPCSPGLSILNTVEYALVFHRTNKQGSARLRLELFFRRVD